MRLRWFLTMTVILMATVGLTVLISEGLDAGGEDGDQVIGEVDGTTPGERTTTTAEDTIPAAVQVTVTGTVTVVHLEGAVLDPRSVPTPLTVVSDRGFGNGGDITGALVDGADKTIVWDGGRPFELSAGGALVLDPVTVDLAPEGLRVGLSGAAHTFQAGTYQLDTPVAVGASGVAEAREAVAFEAGTRTLFEPRGDAALYLPAGGPQHLLGPGTVVLEGVLEARDATGTRTLARLEMPAGSFDLTLTPSPSGWTVAATLEGEITAT